MEENTNNPERQEDFNSQLKRTQEARAQELNYIRDINAEIRKQLTQLKHQNEFRAEVRSILKQTNDIAVKSYDIAEQEINLRESSEDIQKRITENEDNINDNQRERRAIDEKIAILRRENTEESNKLANNLESVSESLLDIFTRSQEFNNSLKSSLQIAKEIENTKPVKLFSGIQDIAKSIPGLKKFSEPFDRAAEASREAAAQNYKIDEVQKLIDGGDEAAEAFKKVGISQEQFDAGKLSPFSAGIKNLSKQISAALSIKVINEFGKALLQANQEVVELSRSLGLTVSEATDLRQEMIGVAATTGDVNVTATKLLQTFSALNKQFGFITNFSNEILATSTQLTEVVGVTEESAGNLAALTALRGGNLENNLETLLDTSRTLQEQRGVQLDTKEILDAVGRVTGEIRANLAANPNAIAEALTLAKQFGGELEDIAASADALLQFETSIAAELKAENLIARELNLNRARSAALQGDLATVAKELTEQAGDYNEFLQMNVIERRALADAVGLEANKLEEILFSQAIQTKSAQELLDIGGADLLQRAKQQSLQEKLNATVDKLKATFVDLGTALVPALDIITKMVSGVGQLIKFLEPVIGILTGAAVGAAAGSVIPGVGNVAGAIIGGIGGAISDVQRMEDGIVDPDGNVIKTPKGSIQLDSEDSVVAGTNLFGETRIPQPNPNRILPPSQMAQQSDYNAVMGDVKLPVQDVAPITTQQQTTQMSDYTVKLESESKKQLEEIKGLRKDIKENTKAVLASGNMVAKTRTKLTVGATDFGTDLNVFSSEIQ